MKKVKIKNNLGEEVEVSEEFAEAYKNGQEYGGNITEGNEDLPIEEFENDF